MNNQISFQSKIKFVDDKKLKRTINITPRIITDIDFDVAYLRHSPNFKTDAIRTCTGGGLIKENKRSCGFHIYHSEHFNNCITGIFEALFKGFKPDRALIVGGKNAPGYEFSMPNFNKIKDVITDNVENVTIFEEHNYQVAETSFMYSLSDDTWYLASSAMQKDKIFNVKSLVDLKNMFRNIKIAKGDRLFIDEKEILPKDFPEIFL